MPYPNESALRLEDPKQYDKYRRTSGGTIYGSKKVPSTIDIIWGHKNGEIKDAWHPQALRFPIKNWSEEKAKAWIEKNIKNYISFDPATKTKFAKEDMINQNLPIYEINPLEGDFQIAIVDQPAIGEYFMSFEDEECVNKIFEFSDDDQRIVYGPVMVPNQLIFRGEKSGVKPCYVKFSEDGIRKAAEYFIQNGLKFNFGHDANKKINANIIQSYFVNEPIDSKFGVEKGSWIVEARINDINDWNSIKNNQLGFSAEGGFIYNQKINNKFKKENMSLKEKFLNFINEAFNEDVETETEVVEETQPIVEETVVEQVEKEEVFVEQPVSGDTATPEMPMTGDTMDQPEMEDMPCPPMEMLTKEDVVKLLEDFMAKIDEKINGVNQKVETFGEQMQPMNVKVENQPLSKYQKWKIENK